MKSNTPQNLDPNLRFQLECFIRDYSRYQLKNRLKKEGIPISSEALDEASELYSQKLTKTLEICMSNLIESDVSNLREIFEKIKQ